MDKKKKRILLISAAVLLVALAIVLCVWLTGGEETILPSELPYMNNYSDDADYPHGDAVEIDGILDEDIWKDRKWFVNTAIENVKELSAKYYLTTYMDEYGIYFASKSVDSNVMDLSGASTAWSIYFAVGEKGKEDQNVVQRFQFDMQGTILRTMVNVQVASTVDGEINSGATNGACMEAFISWKALNIDVSRGIPEHFYIQPRYVAVKDGGSGLQNIDQYWPDWLYFTRFYRFDETGYINADAEDAVIGDSAYGYAKTFGWDLSQIEDGIVRSKYGEVHNRIYFKDFGSDFLVETTMIPVGALGDAFPRGGILFLTSNGVYHGTFLDQYEGILKEGLNGTKNMERLHVITISNNNGTWNQQGPKGGYRDNPLVSTTEGTKLTVLKEGGNLYYFVNDEFFYAEHLDYMNCEVLPGLYTIGADVIFKDYSCQAVTKTEIADFLRDKDVFKITTSASAGGSVSAPIYVEKDGSYDVSITCKSGYEVSSILINDVDVIKDAKKNAKNGVYTVKNVQEDQNVVVKFVKSTDSTISGKIIYEDGADGKDIRIVVDGISNPLLHYEIAANLKNGYSVQLPSGEYHVYLSKADYMHMDATVTVEGEATVDFELIPSAFKWSPSVNGRTVASHITKWDLSTEKDGYVGTSYALKGKQAPLFFKGSGTDFVVKATIEYTTNFVKDNSYYQPDLMGGFVFNNGSREGYVMIRNMGLCITGLQFVEDLKGYGMLTCPDKIPVDLVMVKSGNDVRIYINGVESYRIGWDKLSQNMDPEAEVIVGLYSLMDKPSDIQYSNYSVSFDSEYAKDYIRNFTPKWTTISSLSQITNPAGRYRLSRDIKGNNTTLKQFVGELDGNGHTIETNVQLFDKINGATITDLNVKLNKSITAQGVLTDYISRAKLKNVHIDGADGVVLTGPKDAATGGFAGTAFRAEFEKCSNKITVNGTGMTGGLVGMAVEASNFQACSNSGAITGLEAGGIAGRLGPYGAMMTVTDCQNSGKINATDAEGSGAGGIAGYVVSDITVELVNCSNSGTISGDKGFAGGLVGRHDYGAKLFITSGTNNGNVESIKYAGGFVGYSCDSNGTLAIKDATNNGNITGSDESGEAGGFIGRVFSGSDVDLENCTNKGTITGANAGGMIGYTHANAIETIVTVSGCTNEGTINGSCAGGILGKNDAEASLIIRKLDKKAAVNTGDINGDQKAGGMVGWAFMADVTITEAQNNGKITAPTGTDSDADAGGMIGRVQDCTATVNGCSNKGDVSAMRSGGMVGYLHTAELIANGNTNDGSIYGTHTAGGILGYALDPASKVTLGSYNGKNNVNNGHVYGESETWAGGMLGGTFETVSKIENAVNNGKVGDANRSGGMIGFIYRGHFTANNCVNNGVISGTTMSGEIYGGLHDMLPNIDGSGGPDYDSYPLWLGDDYYAAWLLDREYKSLGTDGTTTVFVGDSFFDKAFWTSFNRDLTGKDALCLGIGGTTVEDWQNFIADKLFLYDIAPKNIVFNLGNNNLHGSSTAEEYADSMQALLNAVHSICPNTKLFMFSVAPRRDAQTNERVSAGNQLMQDWCAQQGDWITFVDISDKLDTSMLVDGVHPYVQYYGSIFLPALEAAGCVIEDGGVNPEELAIPISSLEEITNINGIYRLTGDIVDNTVTVTEFKGMLFGGGYTVKTSVPLFENLRYVTLQDLTVELTRDITASGVIAAYALNSTIENITVSGGAVTGESGHTGGFVGHADNCAFFDCVNTIDVTGTTDGNVGGIVGNIGGAAESIFSNCTNSGMITTEGNNAGGIAGRMSRATNVRFIKCTNAGSISAEFEGAGGILGMSAFSIGGQMIDCVNEGTVTNTNATNGVAGGIAGLVGYGSSMNISGCSNGGTIDATEAGGAIGHIMEATVDIAKSTNSGTVSGKSKAGGMVGWAFSKVTITDAQNTGTITVPLNNDADAGGMIGRVQATTAILTGTTNSGDVTGLRAGGMIGHGHTSQIDIDDASNEGTITGIKVGGMVGRITECVTQITESSNGGVVGNAQSNRAGGMVGFSNTSDLTVEGCVTTEDSIVTGSQAGGMLGYADGTGVITAVNGCTNNGDVRGNEYSGGMIGYALSRYKQIFIGSYQGKGCVNNGKITGDGEDTWAGGMIGGTFQVVVEVENATNNGDVDASRSGGVAGFIYESIFTINDCDNTGVCTGSSMQGELYGNYHIIKPSVDGSGGEDYWDQHITWDGYKKDVAPSRRSEYAAIGRDGATTIFVGDSFFDKVYWTTFVTDLEDKDALCLGIGGTRAEDWLNYISNKLFLNDIAPKNIAVNLGNNDIHSHGLFEYYVRDMKELLTKLHDIAPNANLYMFSVAHRRGADRTNPVVDEANLLMKAWCEAQGDWVTFIDISDQLTTDKLQSDNTHPKVETYGSIFLPALENAGCVMEAAIERPTIPELLSVKDGATYNQYTGIYTVATGTAVTPDAYKTAELTATFVADDWPMRGFAVKNGDNMVTFLFGSGGNNGHRVAAFLNGTALDGMHPATAADFSLATNTAYVMKLTYENGSINMYYKSGENWVKINAQPISLAELIGSSYDADQGVQIGIANFGDNSQTSDVAISTEITDNGGEAPGEAIGISSWAEITDMAGNYYLTQDITVDSTITGFAGTLDGKDHTVTASTYLFANTTGITVKNLNIKLSANTLCALVPTVTDGTFENVHVLKNGDYKFTSNSDLGGLVAQAQGTTTFTNCSNAVDLVMTRAYAAAGGIAGSVLGGDVTFTGCSNTGNITGGNVTYNYMGGIVGSAVSSANVSICGCTNSGEIVQSNNQKAFIGGIMGYFGSTGTLKIASTTDGTKTQNSGIVQFTHSANSDNKLAGGMVGLIGSGTATIENAENSGAIVGKQAGGMVGHVATGTTTLTKCVNKGTVSSSMSDGAYSGGVVGYVAGGTVNVYGCTNEGNITANGANLNATGGIVGMVAGSGAVTVDKAEDGTKTTNSGSLSSSNNGIAGGVVGFVNSTGTVAVNHAANSGNISAARWAGGIVGSGGATTTVTNCTNSDAISCSMGTSYADRAAGGIVGSATNTIITNCTNTGTITGNAQRIFLGGIIGTVDAGTVNVLGCTNSGTIKCAVAANSFAGGIIGSVSGGTVTAGDYGDKHTTNSGNVELTGNAANHLAGGIIGYVGGTTTITNAQNSGNITASRWAGGIAGLVSTTTTVTGCSNTGIIALHTSTHSGSPAKGSIWASGTPASGSQENS